MHFDDVADELCGADPADFVRLRNERAKQARAEGRTDLADAIAALRKPTRVGWVLNLFARTEPDEVLTLLDLAAQLHDAQRSGAADRLRELATERGRLVAQLRNAVVRVAVRHDTKLSQNAIREIDHTLRAALADPDVAEQLRAGRMTGSVEYSGFGPPTLFVVDTAPDSEAETPDITDRAVEDAQNALRLAEVAVDDALRLHRDAARRVDELSERREELRRLLSGVEDELRFARRQVATLESACAEAEHTRDQARIAVDRLRRTTTPD